MLLLFTYTDQYHLKIWETIESSQTPALLPIMVLGARVEAQAGARVGAKHLETIEESWRERGP